MSKSYPVLFNAGTHGTWLSWFINQHEGFPKTKITINRNTGLDYATKGGETDWWAAGYDFLEFRRRHNLNTPKIAYKLMPHHAAIMPQSQFDYIMKESNTVGIVVCEFTESNFQIAGERYDKIRPNNVGERFILFPDNFSWKTHLPVLKCDPLNLMRGIQEEYNNLLEFIEAEPLSDWKEKCNNTIGTFYNIL